MMLTFIKLYTKTLIMSMLLMLAGFGLISIFAIEEDIPGTFTSFGTPTAPLISDLSMTQGLEVITTGSTMIPQTAYTVELDLVDTNGIDTISRMTFKFVYYAGTISEAIAFEEGAYTQTDLNGDVFVYEWERDTNTDNVTYGEVSSGAGDSWLLLSESMPSFAELAEFDTTASFTFEPSKIARQTNRGFWHLVVQVEDEDGLTSFTKIGGLNMSSYAELSVSTSALDFGDIESGSDYADNGSASITGINYISNFLQDHEIYASSVWTSDQLDPADLEIAEATISNDGIPDDRYEFAIKVNDVDDLDSALQLKDFEVLTGSFGPSNELGLDGEYYFFIKLPEFFLNGTYSGTFSVVLSVVF